jgi:UDP-glucose 4-epimerase
MTKFIACDLAGNGLGGFDLRPEILIHCAGSSQVQPSFSQPHKDFQSTVLTASAVLDYVRKAVPDCSVVFASSAAVYGNVTTAPICEDTPLRPISPYGEHKVFVEQLAAYYGRYFHISTAAVRLFSIYGVGLEKQLFWDACNKLARGVRVFDGTGEERRDWMHVLDAAELLIAAAENATPEFLVLNGGSGSSTSVRDALGIIAAALDIDGIEFTGSARQGDPLCYQADMRRAAGLGWRPRLSLDRGIVEYVENFRRTCP